MKAIVMLMTILFVAGCQSTGSSNYEGETVRTHSGSCNH